VAPGILLRPVSLTQVSAGFFLELSLGLHVALACLDRRAIGPGFTRLMTAFSLASFVPAWMLARVDPAGAPAAAPWLALAFAALLVVLLAFAPRMAGGVERAVVFGALAAGLGAMLLSTRAQLGGTATSAAALQLCSSVASMLVLGLVTGAMILGHWYLVTPDLPVAHLTRLTRLALGSTCAKVLLLGATIWLFSDRFASSARAFGVVLGLNGGGSFQHELDFLWLLARVLIGLVGPAALCAMTIATLKLKATQPATGILYAATVTVLMGELFAYVGAQSFGVVL
jgi:hypothetical protein